MEKENIISYFLGQAKNNPEAIALIHGGQKITYAALMERVWLMDACFAGQGVKRGDRILILQPIGIDLYAALLALLGRGCTIVFVEEWTEMKDISSCQEKIGCDFVLGGWKVRILTWFSSSMRNLGWLRIKGRGSRASAGMEKLPGDHVSMISFSSGTSGTSKAIARTQDILDAQLRALEPHIHAERGGVMCTNFPVVVLLNLGLGITTLLSSQLHLSDLSRSDFKGLYGELETSGVTHLAFSPYILRHLALLIKTHEFRPLRFRQVIAGGSPMFPQWVSMIRQSVLTDDFIVLYGSSEAEPIASCKAEEIEHYKDRGGILAGHADKCTQVKIGQIGESGFEPSNLLEAGEIFVTGDHVVKQYIRSEQAQSNNKIRIGDLIWHRTGDYGYFDENGFLFLTGNPEFGNAAGIHLLEEEKQLQSIPGIEYATVVGDICYVQKWPRYPENEIAAEIKNLLGFVRDVRFMDLPRDRRHNGKIKYHLLRR